MMVNYDHIDDRVLLLGQDAKTVDMNVVVCFQHRGWS